VDLALLGLTVGISGPSKKSSGKKSSKADGAAGGSSGKSSKTGPKKKAPCVGAAAGAVDLLGAMVEKKSFLSCDPLLLAAGRTRGHVRRLQPALMCLAASMGDVATLWPTAHEQILASPSKAAVQDDLLGVTAGSAFADIQGLLEQTCTADGLAPVDDSEEAVPVGTTSATAAGVDDPKQLLPPTSLSPRPELRAHSTEHSPPSVFWRTLVSLLIHVAASVRRAAGAAIGRACATDMGCASNLVHALWYDVRLSQLQDAKAAAD